ncbi:MAG TPA: bifunctional diguanylate cyclase/phosphodiesterase, partial [Trueperaceae bacterium]|nr:bifunctional diguanylate cyclase/phosphodiesterase [Trueperaceae bacterium]
VTKLPNSSYLESAARIVLERNAKLGRGAAIVLLDIDRFKIVNDTLGRTQGDRLLHDVARRLQGLVRGGDYVARLGGDEFALLFSGADEAATHAAVDRVIDAVARPFRAGGHDLRLDASVGVSLFPRDGVDLHSLLQRAEIAMYRAKELRLPISFYRHGKLGTRRHSLYLESDLRDALEKDQLELVYQPICRLDTGETIGLEALMRWNHPIRGRLSPGLFVPIAEEIGLIRQIDAHALRVATKQLARWANSGSSVRVSVNVSAQTVSDLQLPDTLMEILREAGAPANQLVLEVTERTALEDIESSAGILQRIRDTGVHIALDDFGKGYSSLGTLDRLPISFLKIDAGFTRGIGSIAKDEHLIKAITLFTKGIGMPFVAEGIENETQRAWLMKEGVRLGQGYLLARPSPAAEVFLPSASSTAETLLRYGPSDQPPMHSRKPN